MSIFIRASKLGSRLPFVPKQQKALYSPWLMWVIAVTFVLFQFFLQLSAGIMLTPLMKSFNLTTVGGGFLIGSFYLVYMFLQIPAGMLVDRLGVRMLLTYGGLVCALGCFLFAMSNSFSLAIIARVLMGVGASFAFVSSLNIVTQWFPLSRFTLMVGLAETFGMVGTLIGNVYLASILSHVSWRHTMFYSSFLALLISFLCFTVIRDNPNRQHNKEIKELTLSDFYRQVLSILGNVGLWLNGLYSGLLFSIVTVFAVLWCLPFLSEVQHVSLSAATFETSFVLIGIAIGGPIMGYIYPRVRNKNTFLSVMALGAGLLCGLIVFNTSMSTSLTSIIFLVLGLICSCYVFNFSLANHLVPKEVSSTSIGFTNSLCVVTAPLLQPFIGFLLDTSSGHVNGQAVYTISNYHFALSVIPISLILAAGMALILPVPDKSGT